VNKSWRYGFCEKSRRSDTKNNRKGRVEKEFCKNKFAFLGNVLEIISISYIIL
jgi:hypothetical protein